jgi:hypothetical protein
MASVQLKISPLLSWKSAPTWAQQAFVGIKGTAAANDSVQPDGTQLSLSLGTRY